MAKNEGFYFDHADLKLCPFCSSTDLRFETYLADGWVECGDCEAKGPCNSLVDAFLEKSEDTAVEEWNDRH